MGTSRRSSWMGKRTRQNVAVDTWRRHDGRRKGRAMVETGRMTRQLERAESRCEAHGRKRRRDWRISGSFRRIRRIRPLSYTRVNSWRVARVDHRWRWIRRRWRLRARWSSARGYRWDSAHTASRMRGTGLFIPGGSINLPRLVYPWRRLIRMARYLM